jgi:hypothetical protein
MYIIIVFLLSTYCDTFFGEREKKMRKNKTVRISSELRGQRARRWLELAVAASAGVAADLRF